MQRDAVDTAFLPFPGFRFQGGLFVGVGFLPGFCFQFVGLVLRKAGYRLGRFPAKGLGDPHLGVDVLLHFVGIKDLGYAGLSVTRSRVFVASDPADRRLRGAACVTAVFAKASAGALRRELAIEAHARADAHTYAAGFVAGLVLYVAGGERAACAEVVFVVVDGFLRAGDRIALEIRVVCDIDVEALVPSFQTTLLSDAGKVAVHFTFAGAEAATHLAVTD